MRRRRGGHGFQPVVLGVVGHLPVHHERAARIGPLAYAFLEMIGEIVERHRVALSRLVLQPSRVRRPPLGCIAADRMDRVERQV